MTDIKVKQYDVKGHKPPTLTPLQALTARNTLTALKTLTAALHRIQQRLPAEREWTAVRTQSEMEGERMGRKVQLAERDVTAAALCFAAPGCSCCCDAAAASGQVQRVMSGAPTGAGEKLFVPLWGCCCGHAPHAVLRSALRKGRKHVALKSVRA